MDVLIFWQRPLTEPTVFFALKTDPTDPSTAYQIGWKRWNMEFQQKISKILCFSLGYGPNMFQSFESTP